MSDERNARTLAKTSMVLGIMSMIGFGFLTGIPALIIAHIARSRLRKAPPGTEGRGFALTGLVLGYAGTAVSIAVVLAVVEKKIERAESTECCYHLKQMALSARQYDDGLSAFSDLAPHLGSPQTILVCPSDHKLKSRLRSDRPRQPGSLTNSDPAQPNSWISNDNVSYELLCSPARWGMSPMRPLFRCKIHGNLAYADGGVERAPGKALSHSAKSSIAREWSCGWGSIEFSNDGTFRSQEVHLGTNVGNYKFLNDARIQLDFHKPGKTEVSAVGLVKITADGAQISHIEIYNPSGWYAQFAPVP